jgi:hypothetical protein
VTLPRAAFALCLTLTPTLAFAQSTCSTCEDCTQALAAPHADVRLGGDLPLRGAGPCITVRGEGAHFDGARHVILAQPAGGIGVRVEGVGAVVRNLRVTGAATGVAVAARDVTLYQVVTEARGVGVRVEASPGVRLDRVRTTGGRVGVSFGAADDGSCAAGLTLRSPGAVVVASTFERAAVGLAACDARPVLTGNTASGNGVGVTLGDPAAASVPHGDAPWDPCVCGAPLERLRPGQLAMFSSGCGGCMVHEGWMPALRRRGVEVRVRENGRGAETSQQRFDAWAWRCATGVMDALGIPGCVPNYACAATGTVSKRRQGEAELVMDAALNGEDDVFNLARSCAAGAQGRYVAGARCVAQALADNTFCHNRTRDLRVTGDAARWGGVRNRCARAEGWSESGHAGCTATCDGAPMPAPEAPAPPVDPAPTPAPATATPPPPAPPAPATATPTAAPAPASARTTAPTDGGNGPLWVMGGFMAVLAAAGLLTRKR